MRTLFILFICSVSLQVRAVTLEAAKGKIEFLAIGRPSAIKIKGQGKGPTGDLKFVKAAEGYTLDGVAQVDLSSFDTGISMRDRHMKEKYLEVEKFGEAKLSFKSAKIPAEIVNGQGTIEVPAELELHGKKNPVQVKVTAIKKGDALSPACQFKIKLSDYGIEIPQFSGITVANEVEITASLELSEKSVREGI